MKPLRRHSGSDRRQFPDLDLFLGPSATRVSPTGRLDAAAKNLHARKASPSQLCLDGMFNRGLDQSNDVGEDQHDPARGRDAFPCRCKEALKEARLVHEGLVQEVVHPAKGPGRIEDDEVKGSIGSAQQVRLFHGDGTLASPRQFSPNALDRVAVDIGGVDRLDARTRQKQSQHTRARPHVHRALPGPFPLRKPGREQLEVGSSLRKVGSVEGMNPVTQHGQEHALVVPLPGKAQVANLRKRKPEPVEVWVQLVQEPRRHATVQVDPALRHRHEKTKGSLPECFSIALLLGMTNAVPARPKRRDKRIENPEARVVVVPDPQGLPCQEATGRHREVGATIDRLSSARAQGSRTVQRRVFHKPPVPSRTHIVEPSGHNRAPAPSFHPATCCIGRPCPIRARR